MATSNKMRAPISDLVAGLYAALGTVEALYRRVQTGRGGRVAVTMLDSEVAKLSDASSLLANAHPTCLDEASCPEHPG